MQSKSMKLKCSVIKIFIRRTLSEPVLGRKTIFALV